MCLAPAVCNNKGRLCLKSIIITISIPSVRLASATDRSSDENFTEQRKPSKNYRHDQNEHINCENSLRFSETKN